jgi:hypothetical protein
MHKTYPCPNGIEPDCGYPTCAHALQCERAAPAPSDATDCSPSSDTPETDAAICFATKTFGMIGKYVTAEFSRNLEKEKNVMRHEIELLRRELANADKALEDNISTFIILREEKSSVRKEVEDWKDVAANAERRTMRAEADSREWQAVAALGAAKTNDLRIRVERACSALKHHHMSRPGIAAILQILYGDAIAHAPGATEKPLK